MTFPLSSFHEAADAIRAATALKPKAGLVLGSGLDALADLVHQPTVLPYGQIPHFPESTALGHKGDLMLGHIADVPVMVMRGRFHLYEGYSPQQTVFPIRVMHIMGVRTVILTNAAGGLNPEFRVGDIMVIEDHISFPGLAGLNPLRGPNLQDFGERFPALNHTYTPELIHLAHRLAADQGLALRQGVYAHVAGPNFETPAEVRMLGQMGADAVGMSTVPEAIVAKHAGMPVLGFSTITNICVAETTSTEQPDAADVVEAARRVEQGYQALFLKLVPALVS